MGEQNGEDSAIKLCFYERAGCESLSTPPRRRGCGLWGSRVRSFNCQHIPRTNPLPSRFPNSARIRPAQIMSRFVMLLASKGRARSDVACGFRRDGAAAAISLLLWGGKGHRNEHQTEGGSGAGSGIKPTEKIIRIPTTSNTNACFRRFAYQRFAMSTIGILSSLFVYESQ